MVTYKHIRKSFTGSMRSRSPAFRKRLSNWKKGRTIERVAKPTNPKRAGSLGYKATKAFTIVRVKVKRGKRSRRKADLGRKPGKTRKFVNPGRSLQFFAQEKAKRKFSNLSVVNSYFVGEDGIARFYEVILRDPKL